MKLSLSKTAKGMDYAVLLATVAAMAQTSMRTALGEITITPLTDSSGGTPAATVVAVPRFEPFTHAAGASDLPPTADFNTAIGKTDDAIAVLATYLNVNVFTPLGIDALTVNATGTVDTAGTVAAQDLTLTGTDAATALAASRTEVNAALAVTSNNMATLMRGINIIANAIGVATLMDNTGGKADEGLIMVDQPTVATSVTNTGDAPSNINVTTALTNLANNLATIATWLNDTALDSTVLGARNLIQVTP